jgi:hypothetical protein
MKAALVLGVAVAFIAMVTEAQSASLLEKHPIDWYDCSGKSDGNYLHPTDCTRFISCSGHIASERDCANCDPSLHPGRCPSVGRLVYNDTVDECLWADQTECKLGDGDEGKTTYEPPYHETTSENPEEPPTTENPENEGPIEGESCDPDNCKTRGNCLDYWRCDPNTKIWTKEKCGHGLLWNPLGADGKPHIHGGNCGDPKKLHNETLEQYRKDPECLECYWKENGECSASYFYRPPGLYYPEEHKLECDAGLVFVKDKETCLRCEDAKNNNGQSCC